MEVLQEQIQIFSIALVVSVVFHSVQCDLLYSTYMKITAKERPSNVKKNPDSAQE